MTEKSFMRQSVKSKKDNVVIKSIVFDGSNTLYSDNNPISQEILDFVTEIPVSEKIFFSNIGGVSSKKLLRDKNIPKHIFKTHLTSYDLLVSKLKPHASSLKVYVYGNENVKNEVKKLFVCVSLEEATDILFCNIDFDGGINEVNRITKVLIQRPSIRMHLANNDRISLNPQSNLTVANVLDAVNQALQASDIIIKPLVYGKPFLSRADLKIRTKQVLVVGDNVKTDGVLATNLDASFLLVNTQNIIERLEPWYDRFA